LSLDQCLKTDKEKEMSNVPYVSAVRGLMYAMLCTRPDIYFVVGLVSRYQSNPKLAHCQAVKTIMRSLRDIANLVSCYQGEDLKFEGTQMPMGVVTWMSRS